MAKWVAVESLIVLSFSMLKFLQEFSLSLLILQAKDLDLAATSAKEAAIKHPLTCQAQEMYCPPFMTVNLGSLSLHVLWKHHQVT